MTTTLFCIRFFVLITRHNLSIIRCFDHRRTAGPPCSPSSPDPHCPPADTWESTPIMCKKFRRKNHPMVRSVTTAYLHLHVHLLSWRASQKREILGGFSHWIRLALKEKFEMPELKPKRAHLLQEYPPGVEPLQIDGTQQGYKHPDDHDDKGKGHAEAV